MNPQHIDLYSYLIKATSPPLPTDNNQESEVIIMGHGPVRGAVSKPDVRTDEIVPGCKKEPGVKRATNLEHCAAEREAKLDSASAQAGYNTVYLGPHEPAHGAGQAWHIHGLGDLGKIDTNAGPGRNANIGIGPKTPKEVRLYPLIFGPVPLTTKKP